MGQHVNAMTAGTFDAGYTLEPNATIMRKKGVATTLRGRRDRQIRPGRSEGQCLGRRLRLLDRLHQRSPTSPSASPRPGPRPSTSSTTIPNEARKYLAKNTLTPDDVVDTVPMLGYIMAKDLKPGHRRFPEASSTSTKIGIVPEKVDVTKYLKSSSDAAGGVGLIRMKRWHRLPALSHRLRPGRRCRPRTSPFAD